MSDIRVGDRVRYGFDTGHVADVRGDTALVWRDRLTTGDGWLPHEVPLSGLRLLDEEAS